MIVNPQRSRATLAAALQKHPVAIAPGSVLLSPLQGFDCLLVAGLWALPMAITFHAFSVNNKAPSLTVGLLPRSPMRRKLSTCATKVY